MENSKTTAAFAIGLLALHVSIGFAVQANDGDCSQSQYQDSQGLCQSCHGRGCQPGQKIVKNCGNGQDVTCEPCKDLEPDHTCESGKSARPCISCEHQNKKQVQACDANSDSICEGCLDNYYAKVVGLKVYCIHCREDTKNRTECRTEPPVIQPDGKGNDDPKVPGAEIRKGKDTKGQDALTPVSITIAISTLAIAILSLIAVLWRKSIICKGRSYKQTARGEDVESPRSEASKRDDESQDEEDTDKAVCHIEGNKTVRFLKRQLSASSTKSESEDQERLLENSSTTKSKHRPPKLTLRRTSGVREVNVEVHGAGSQSVHDVDATPFQKDGTPSPYSVEEDDVFLHSSKTTEAVKGCPDEAEIRPVPGTDIPHTPRESKDFSGQTAKIHSTNNTANKYHTTLALCTKHADTIRLEDEWFNYNIQQKLSVYLDKIQPTPSMPTWRTFFEKFNLTKNELDAVYTRSVPSPTLALFNMLQKSNPGAANYFTVGDVLRQLDSMKFTDAASALCDELLEHINQSKS